MSDEKRISRSEQKENEEVGVFRPIGRKVKLRGAPEFHCSE